jgi:hypothetical protein
MERTLANGAAAHHGGGRDAGAPPPAAASSSSSSVHCHRVALTASDRAAAPMLRDAQEEGGKHMRTRAQYPFSQFVPFAPRLCLSLCVCLGASLLAAFLHPLPPEFFLQHIWKQKALHISWSDEQEGEKGNPTEVGSAAISVATSKKRRKEPVSSRASQLDRMEYIKREHMFNLSIVRKERKDAWHHKCMLSAPHATVSS